MGAIRNPDTLANIRNILHIQQGADPAPVMADEKAIITIDATPRIHRVCNIIRGINCINATSATIYTTPTDRDFYLVAANLSMIKDVTSDSISSSITITVPDGTNQNVISIIGLNATIQNNVTSQNWAVPILVKRGTNITVTNSTATANCSSRGVIQGYTVDPQ